MLLSQVLDSLARRDGVCTASAPDDWMQGRSLFGGLQVALALRAMRGLVPAELPLRVLQTTFVAPVTGALEIHPRLLRVGKGTTHAEARVIERDQVTTLVVGVFGRGRPSNAEVRPPPPAPSPDAPHAVPFPFIPGLSPAFAQHFKMRILSGPLPYSGSRLPPKAVFEVSLADTAATSEAHVVAIGDALPPLALAEPAPGSSVTWTLELLGDRFDALPLAGWQVEAEVRAAHNGYTSQSSAIFGPGGEPVALSHQSMVVFG
jgi:Thioesterase-like superfamily